MKKRSQAAPDTVEADQPANGKVVNDTNKPAAQATQRNEARRTPASRSDRDSQIGSGNQAQMRRGTGGLGR